MGRLEYRAADKEAITTGQMMRLTNTIESSSDSRQYPIWANVFTDACSELLADVEGSV